MSLNRPIWKVCDWFPISELDVGCLSQNPRAFSYLMEHPEEIDWRRLSANPSCDAIEYLRAFPQRIVVSWLVHNPSAECLPLIRERLHQLTANDWCTLCKRDYAIDLLRENPDKIKWYMFSENPAIFVKVDGKMQLRDWISPGKLNFDALCSNPNAIDYVLQFPRKIKGFTFSMNPNAVPHLVRMPHLINWRSLALNPSPLAIQMLRENPDKIAFELLCSNPNPDAASLFRGVDSSLFNLEKLACNEGVFVLDYDAMRRNGERLESEFIAEVMHPRRIFADPSVDRIELLFGDE